MKSPPAEQPELATFRIEQLNAGHVGRHQLRGSFENVVIQGIEVALLNQQRADFMEDVVRRIELWRFRLLKHDTVPWSSI